MEFDETRMINLLIFEHACKHNMTGLIKYAVHDQELFQYLRVDTADSEINSRLAISKVQPVFPFILLLRQFSSSLNCHTDQIKDMLSWNRKLLVLIIELLNSTYQQYPYIPLKSFSRLISQLKLLDLVRLLVEGTPSQVIIQRLNLFFPRWTSNLKMTIEKHFNVQNPKMLNRIKESHVKCRRLILRFAASDACRENYVLHKCSSDLKKFMNDSTYYLKQAIASLEKNAGPTVIEKLIKNSDGNLLQSDDPQVQIFLEYLHPGMSEKEFIRIIHSLEPNAASQPDAGFFSCLSPFDVLSDTCSELASELGCDSDYSLIGDDNSQNNSVLGEANCMVNEQPTSEKSHVCLEKRSMWSDISCEICTKGDNDYNAPLTEMLDMEIIEDSEEELP